MSNLGIPAYLGEFGMTLKSANVVMAKQHILQVSEVRIIISTDVAPYDCFGPDLPKVTLKIKNKYNE